MPSADAGPVVFVADLDVPVLAPGDVGHLVRSLRLRSGASLVLADGAGGHRPARLRSTDGEVEPTGAVVRQPRPAPVLTVAFAVTKGSRPELAVQKLTEVGVDRIVAFHAARSVARWEGERADRHLERLRRVTREAAMQSRRPWLPEVEVVAGFTEVAALPGALLADMDGEALPPGSTTVLVGPEGGWSEEERASGLARVVLGPHVLRAETAAVVAGAVLAGHRAGLLGPPR